jgi:hypothetical protein
VIWLRWFIVGFVAGSLLIVVAETEEVLKLFKNPKRQEPEVSQ